MGMRVTAVWGSLVAALGLFAGASLAQQESVSFTTDKDHYIYPGDPGGDSAVVVTVDGLTTCAGMNVSVGLFLETGQVGSIQPATQEEAAVNDSGQAQASVELPRATGFYPGVVAVCAPGGGAISSTVVQILRGDPDRKSVV